MSGLGRKCAAGIAAVFAAATLSGCAAYQGIEPIMMPPSNYQADTAVRVEFVHPALVGVRCAERGVRFLGMPGINSGACADDRLITMPNPCFAVAGGWYASVMCHEMAHINGWAHDHRGGSLFAQAPIQPARLSAAALQHAAATEVAAADAGASANPVIQPRTVHSAPIKVVATGKPAPNGKAATLAALRTGRPTAAVPMRTATVAPFGAALAQPASFVAQPIASVAPPLAVSAFDASELVSTNLLPDAVSQSGPPTVFTATAALAGLRFRLSE